MTFEEMRTQLAGLEGKKYWRSLDELAATPEFNEFLHREFPAHASEFTDPKGRRTFLRLMGASLALAGVSACTRQPDEKILPYVRQPEEIIPGRPLFYATSMPHAGMAVPLLAENHMGRPTHMEGNPDHPGSLGGTDVFGQASVLGLYDPDRSKAVLYRGEPRTWGDFVTAIQSVARTQRALKGQTLRFLSEPISSPSLLDQIEQIRLAYPESRWHQWDAVFGVVQGGVPAATPVYHFDKADVVVSLDSDFLDTGASMVRYSKDFSSRRRIGTPQDELNRLYVVEPVPTLTGAKAEHRLAMKARDVHAFAESLAGAVGAGPALSAAGDAALWVEALAEDLKAHRGRSAVVAGERQPAAVHQLVRAMNDALGNTGTTVSYGAAVTETPADGVASLSELVGDMKAGKVDTLVILGGNPVFTAPADLDFTGALGKVGTRIHVGLYDDETAEQCHWHLPEAHYLESWGDARSFDGTVSLIQPLIAPLYDGHQAIEVLSLFNGAPGAAPAALTAAATPTTPTIGIGGLPVDLVRNYWTRAFEGKTTAKWTLVDADGKPFKDAATAWRHGLHDGFFRGTGSQGSHVEPAKKPAADKRTGPSALVPAPGAMTSTVIPSPEPPTTSGMEIVFRPDPYILDGRFANNGWLQELPKPLSKATWDNVCYIGTRMAERLGVPASRPGNTGQDVLAISYLGRTVNLPVLVLPGTADDVIAVHFGYGRRKSGKVGNAIGVDVFPIRTSKAPWYDGGATVAKTGTTYPIATTQNHFLMEERNPVRVVDAEDYRNDPKAVAKIGPNRPDPRLSLFPAVEYKDDKWGMSIDLNACTGCNVCITACQSENNIAVVGKSQVMKTREMHWIRVDTYYEGDLDSPKMYHQPVPCQQCEDAPCELVCPVAATSHNDEGLNDMVYNRCVGTRYCSNNCPFKVRRFNFLLYTDYDTESFKSQRNPDVTPRSRGVMEKCTYCVQRISHARIDSKTENRRIRDGEIKTACQQACPTDAIVFGNLNDPDSKLVSLVKQQRNYGLLEDLGVRPRTTYLAVVRNPNPKLKA
jgi:MoCo/4Fe-4S cofactor protein with predicted Tat translocation signal